MNNNSFNNSQTNVSINELNAFATSQPQLDSIKGGVGGPYEGESTIIIGTTNY